MLLSIFGLWGCSSSKGDLAVVPTVDLQRYTGTWYEIMRIPHSFENGLKCVTANYSIKPNGDIKVENMGHKVDDPSRVKTAIGTAWVPNANEPSKLKVRFFWPFSGNYWILALDRDYRYAMIGDPSRDYLWILSRDKSLPQSTLDALLQQAKTEGFDITRLEHVAQDCE